MEASQTILEIDDLKVDFRTNQGIVHAVRGVSLNVQARECLGIVGESGSGKSQTFLAAMNLLSRNSSVTGRVDFAGQNLLDLPVGKLNAIRGHRIAMIFQDPLTSLTPHLRIGEQMQEVLRVHKHLSGSVALQQCQQWLDRVRIPEARYRLKQYPHELSGGMRQRVMIAMAMLCEPSLLIADEPTTALDVTIQADILDLMDELRHDHETAIALITHDMGVVARMCDRVHVMRHGKFVEKGSCHDIFYRPQSAYTQSLLDAVPKIDLPKTHSQADDRHSDLQTTQQTPDQSEPVNLINNDTVLRVENLRVSFPVKQRLFSKPKTLRAVDGISFDLQAGETLGIVGESGSGKSTLARAILQLIPPTSGKVSWLGRDLSSISKAQLKQLRRDMQIVFQDPLASLNPTMTIGDSIAEPLRIFDPAMKTVDRVRKIANIMERVGLNYTLINRYPHELSGGQNQRVGIARAMVLQPGLLICDEAVSALDVSIQAQIIALLKDLQSEFNLSLIFISHDLSVVWEISQRILVMYLGSVVEMAPRNDLFSRPQHPYTQQLISAVPAPDPEIERQRQRIKLMGELSSPMDPGARLRFLPSLKEHVAPDYVPLLSERFAGHFVAEHDDIDTLLRH